MRYIKICLSASLPANTKDYKIKSVPNTNTFTVTKISDGTVYTLVPSKPGKLKCDCTAFKFKNKCKHVDLVVSEVGPITEGPTTTNEVVKDSTVKRYPRQVVEAFIPKLKTILDPCGHWEVVGSYRRGSPTLKDVDILLVCEHGTFLELDKKLRKLKDYVPTISGKELIRGDYKGIPIDIQRVIAKEWTSYLFYRTGPQAFNISTRSRAKKMGLKLNEHGLFRLDTGKLLPAKTEQDLFKHLGLKYVEPNQRG
jgi:hypothetical protein